MNDDCSLLNFILLYDTTYSSINIVNIIFLLRLLFACSFKHNGTCKYHDAISSNLTMPGYVMIISLHVKCFTFPCINHVTCIRNSNCWWLFHCFICTNKMEVGMKQTWNPEWHICEATNPVNYYSSKMIIC